MVALLFLLLVSGCLAQQNDDDDFPSVGAAGGYFPEEELFRWAVGIYRKDDNQFKQICGGSLASLQLVISAAHCFWSNGKTSPAEQFAVSAGNEHRDLAYPESKQIQLVEQIVVHPRYHGADLKYAHDIAVIKLTKKMAETAVVTPINIDWSSSFADEDLVGQRGSVVGWGYTESDKPSEVRVAVNLPYVDFETCWNTVPRQFRSSITPDKFCAGLRNGTSVCPGDSGGGLAFYSEEKRMYYLRGIVSVGAQPEGLKKCHTTQLSAFTSISSYRDWLKDEMHALTVILRDDRPWSYQGTFERLRDKIRNVQKNIFSGE